jgi:hypothetical protein
MLFILVTNAHLALKCTPFILGPVHAVYQPYRYTLYTTDQLLPPIEPLLFSWFLKFSEMALIVTLSLQTLLYDRHSPCFVARWWQYYQRHSPPPHPPTGRTLNYNLRNSTLHDIYASIRQSGR